MAATIGQGLLDDAVQRNSLCPLQWWKTGIKGVMHPGLRRGRPALTQLGQHDRKLCFSQSWWVQIMNNPRELLFDRIKCGPTVAEVILRRPDISVQ